jgi:hypothetical protein
LQGWFQNGVSETIQNVSYCFEFFFENAFKNGLKTINVHVNYRSKFSQQQLNICLTEEG